MWWRAERRRWPRAGAALLVVAAVVLLPAAPAAAHPVLEHSSPGDGQSLDSTPRALRLDFSEPVLVDSVRIEVHDRHLSDATEPVVDTGGAEETRQVRAQLPVLAPDVYVVQWAATSAADGHRVTGVFSFGLRRDAAPTATQTAGPDGSSAGLAVAGTVGSALALGCLLLWTALVPPRGRSGHDPDLATRLGARAARLAAAGAAVAAVAVVTDLLLAARQPPGLATLLATGHGGRVLVQAGVLSVVAFGAATAARARTGAARRLPRHPAVLLGGASLAVAVGAVDSHASGDGPAGWAVAVAHAVAASSWAGGLLALTVLVGPLLASPGRRRSLAVATLSRLRWPALVSVAVLVVTGLLLVGRQVSTVSAATRTPYGLELGAKLALVCVALLIGLRHTRGLHARVRRAPSRRSLGAEALVLLGVLGLGAVLTATPPAHGPGLVPTADATSTRSTPETVTVDDLVVRLALAPDVVGPSSASITVLQTRRPRTAPVRGVDLTVAGDVVPASQLTRTLWQAPVDLPPGPLTARVTIHRDGAATSVAEVGWSVGGELDWQQAPLAPVLRQAAALASLLLLLGLLVFLATRRRAGPGGRGPAGAGAEELATWAADTADAQAVPR